MRGSIATVVAPTPTLPRKRGREQARRVAPLFSSAASCNPLTRNVRASAYIPSELSPPNSGLPELGIICGASRINPTCAGEVTARRCHVDIEQHRELRWVCPSPHPFSPFRTGEGAGPSCCQNVPYLAEAAADYAGSAKQIVRKSGEPDLRWPIAANPPYGLKCFIFSRAFTSVEVTCTGKDFEGSLSSIKSLGSERR